jgi:hypothetical protein
MRDKLLVNMSDAQLLEQFDIQVNKIQTEEIQYWVKKILVEIDFRGLED